MKHLLHLARMAHKAGVRASVIDADVAHENADALAQLAALHTKRDALANREPGLVATLQRSTRRIPVMRSLTRLIFA